MLINYDSKVTVFTTKTPYGLIDSDVREPRYIFDRTVNTNNVIIDKGIGIIECAIDRDMCKYIIGQIERSHAWQKAVTVGESSGKVRAEDSPRQNDILMISVIPELETLDQFLNRVYGECMAEYLAKVSGLTVLEAGLTRDEGYQALRYPTGGYYKSHIDYSSRTVDGNETIRAVSGLIYLTDDHEGGEVDFPAQNLKIKPKAGSVVFFPSIFTHPHASCPVTEGTKYSIVTWWK